MATDITEAFKFNPFTGNELKKIDLNTLEDVATGKKIYLNPKPCTIAMITNGEGKLLMVVRAREPHKGTWELPGGFMNLEETAEESVIRECREELNIEVTNLRYVGSCPEVYEFDGVTHRLLILGFKAELVEGKKLTAMDDVASYKYFGSDEIPWEGINFECIRFFVKKFVEANK